MARASKPIERTCLGYAKAVALMRQEGHRLMLMHVPWGKAYFVVPGGMVSKGVAEAIMSRIGVHPQKDGLFPGHSQTWILGWDR